MSIDISNTEMLMTMNRLASEASTMPSQSRHISLGNMELSPGQASFSDALKGAVGELDLAQKSSTEAKKAVLEQRPGASMADMLEKSSKAQVSMAAAIEVRNKLLEAYTNLSNMPL